MINLSTLKLCAVAGITLLSTGCAYMSQGFAEKEAVAVVAPDDFFNDSANRIIYPEQNWDSADSLWFYNTTQGSNLLPYDILLNLEQAQSSERFLDTKNVEKYRYLPQKASYDNKDALPVGWVKDTHNGKDYIGFTCAACHTTQINYKGTGMRIDGGPTLGDMESLLGAIENSLAASQENTNPEKFERLFNKINPQGSSADKQAFSSEIAKAYKDIRFYNCSNQPVHPGVYKDRQDKDPHNNACFDDKDEINYGYGRLDAIGRIYNRTLLHIGGKDKNGSLIETTRTLSPTSPVSYPFLWDTPQHDFVQWNGLLENNFGYVGPLGRNTGEVVGVFATIDIEDKGTKVEYDSSVEVRNLIRLEDHLKSLWSPSWEDMAINNMERKPEHRGSLPPIKKTCDDGSIICAEEGEKIFKEYACAACHQAIDRTSSSRVVTAQMSSLEVIKTDPNMVRQALEACGDSGLLEPVVVNKGLDICPGDQKAGGSFDPKSAIPALTAVSEVTAGVLQAGIFNSLYLTFQSAIQVIKGLIDEDTNQRHVDFEAVNKNFLNAYKGRPLNGIWATAPYLHNGSVPNLYDLLLPTCENGQSGIGENNTCRPEAFTVGQREFDPVKVGLKTENLMTYKAKAGEPSLFIYDTSLYGNHNYGHEYAAGKDPIPLLDENGQPRRDATGKPLGIDTWEVKPALNHEQRMALIEYIKTL
ncbi:10S-dioxygenase [Oceaniserpentilla sp. 4NH20-0058]|uniref:di-heme-cytochrome C peroxidase n=1 Tax=Oceaniserpentilla sp. 4NH20-0058 TaxID=3127660 RepID=UPI00310353D4